VQKFAEALKVKANKAVESIVVTLPGISTDVGNAQVIIEGSIDFLLGATGTEVVVRVRRGTTTAGTEVAKVIFNALTAAKSYGLSVQCQDQQEAEIASGSYVLTVENVGATTEGEAVQASLTATF
jgi:uncharacterized Zn-binding protein involved in type VI secretion